MYTVLGRHASSIPKQVLSCCTSGAQCEGQPPRILQLVAEHLGSTRGRSTYERRWTEMRGWTHQSRQRYTLWRSNDLDLSSLRHETLDLSLETLWHVREHGGTTRHHNIAQEVLSDIEVAVVDSLLGQLVQTHHLL